MTNPLTHAIIQGHVRQLVATLGGVAHRSITMGPVPILADGLVENLWVRPHFRTFNAIAFGDKQIPCRHVQAYIVGATSPASTFFLHPIRIKDESTGVVSVIMSPVLRLPSLLDTFPGPYGIITIDTGAENSSLAIELFSSGTACQVVIVGPSSSPKETDETIIAVAGMQGYVLKFRVGDYLIFGSTA